MNFIVNEIGRSCRKEILVKIRRLSFVILVVLAATLSAVVVKRPTANGHEHRHCSERSTILMLSDLVLSNRHKLGRFGRLSSWATDAAYLKLRYGNMSITQSENLLRELMNERVRGSKELAFAFIVAEKGLASAISSIKWKYNLPIDELYFTGIRALILADGGTTFFAMVGSSKRKQGFIGTAASLLTDMPDSFKSEFAKQAEAKGHLELAGAVLSSQSSTNQFVSFLNRITDHKLRHKIAVGLNLQGVQKTKPYVSAKYYPPALQKPSQEMYEILKASLTFTTAEFFAHFALNPELIEKASQVAREYLALVKERSLDPGRDPDGALIFLYEKLALKLGRDFVDQSLSEFSINAGKHYDGMAREILDWMIAGRLVAKFYANEAELPEPRPKKLTDKLDWKTWREVAFLIKAGNNPEAKPFRQATAQELKRSYVIAENLFQSSRYGQLITFINEAFSGKALSTIATDFAIRLDRVCAFYFEHQGSGVLLGGERFHKF